MKTDTTETAAKPIDLAAGRRAFVKALGLSAVGAVVMAAAEGTLTSAMAQTVTDADVLTFALNLEYLEATFYHYAYFGTDIPAKDTVSSTGAASGKVKGGAQANLKNKIVKAYAKELATEELKHVEALRYLLAAAKAPVVARPELNIGSAFATAAKAAGINNGGSFNAYANDTSFLLASYIFEDVGVTAYHGAAGLLSSKTNLNYAAGILAVEAYHAGIIRTALFAAESAAAVQDTQLISNLRSALANAGKIGVDDIGIGTPGQPSIVDVDAPNATQFVELPGGDAIAYARTPQQVLNIVYGNANATPGLFFPQGLNGNVK